MDMERRSHVGLAMYTIHHSASVDMKAAFETAAAMGYKGIEFYGEPVFDPSKIKEALSSSGLAFTGWQIEWRDLQPSALERTIRYLTDVECPLAVVPCLGGKWNIAHTKEQECEEVWKQHIQWLNQTETVLSRYGIRMGYHNHEHEFELHYDGKPLFDYLFDSLSETIVMELDSGNCIEGGDDPVRVLEKYQSRPKILHLKPFSRTRGFNTTLGAEDDENDWASMVGSGRYSYEWMLVESENDVLSEQENCRLCMEGLKKFL